MTDIKIMPLAGIIQGPIREKKDFIHVEGTAREARKCQYCGGFDIRPHGTFKHVLHDIPKGGKPVRWTVTVPRYRCPTCSTTADNTRQVHRTGSSDLSYVVNPTRRVTTRLEVWIAKQSLYRNYKDIVTETEVAYSTVRECFVAALAAVDLPMRLSQLRWAVFTPVLIRKTDRLMVSDGYTGATVDLLPDLMTDTLANFMGHLRKIRAPLQHLTVPAVGSVLDAVDKHRGKVPMGIHPDSIRQLMFLPPTDADVEIEGVPRMSFEQNIRYERDREQISKTLDELAQSAGARGLARAESLAAKIGDALNLRGHPTGTRLNEEGMAIYVGATTHINAHVQAHIDSEYSRLRAINRARTFAPVRALALFGKEFGEALRKEPENGVIRLEEAE